MKKILIFLSCITVLILSVGCNSQNDNNNTEVKSDNALLLPQELEVVDHALLISYTSSFDGENSFSDYLTKNFSSLSDLNILNDEKLNIKDHVIIEDEDLDELFDILYKQSCSDDLVGNCFTPNHAVVYYDHNNKVMGYTEICFDCITSVSSQNIPTLKLCNSKMNQLMDFMKKHNVTYFDYVI